MSTVRSSDDQWVGGSRRGEHTPFHPLVPGAASVLRSRQRPNGDRSAPARTVAPGLCARSLVRRSVPLFGHVPAFPPCSFMPGWASQGHQMGRYLGTASVQVWRGAWPCVGAHWEPGGRWWGGGEGWRVPGRWTPPHGELSLTDREKSLCLCHHRVPWTTFWAPSPLTGSMVPTPSMGWIRGLMT